MIMQIESFYHLFKRINGADTFKNLFFANLLEESKFLYSPLQTLTIVNGRRLGKWCLSKLDSTLGKRVQAGLSMA